jgi:hypothetical protein
MRMVAALFMGAAIRPRPVFVKMYPSSFRDAPLGAGPESILPVVVMDTGLALTRAPE